MKPLKIFHQMKKILSLQHWQIFLLISIRVWTPPSPFELLTSVISAATVLIWLYSVVIYGAKKAEQRGVSYSLNLKFFKLNFILLVPLFAGLTFVSHYGFNVPKLILQVCTFYTIFGTFYSMAAAAKTITSLTQQRNVPFKDYFLVFVMMLFLFIGVWIVQPKVNELIA